MIPHISVAVAGAGVVGLNIAKELASIPAFKDGVAVFEKSAVLGEGQSGHSSGVIHAGIYYEPGSLKALLCPDGRKRTTHYATLCHIPWEEVEKVIAATSSAEEPSLEKYLRRALANGLREGEDIELITGKKARDLVPSLHCTAALYSKRTGIIDAASYIQELKQDVLRQGAQLYLQNEIIDVRPTENYVEFDVKIQQRDIETYRADYFINAAGLYADKLARMINPSFPHHIIPIRGEYCTYTITREELSINNMNIYPLPTDVDMGGYTRTSLGTHLTPTFSMGKDGPRIGKTVLVGPYAQKGPPPKFKTEEERKEYEQGLVEKIHDLVKRHSPAIQREDLQFAGGYTGIQASLERYADFIFQRDEKFPHCLQIVGSDSPFLTASAAAGNYAQKMLLKI